MHIGIDFDNTIICYDTVFSELALRKELVPASLEKGKTQVRDFLRAAGKEREWTILQGEVYGKMIDLAPPHNGVMDFLQFCRNAEIVCHIVSHKTRFPYAGEKVDLHAAAERWIKHHNIPFEVFFEPEKEMKVERIRQIGCDVFIDDLPEFLMLDGFADGIQKILFDPNGRFDEAYPDLIHMHTWHQISEQIEAWNR